MRRPVQRSRVFAVEVARYTLGANRNLRFLFGRLLFTWVSYQLMFEAYIYAIEVSNDYSIRPFTQADEGLVRSRHFSR